jgi:hypothetical protein
VVLLLELFAGKSEVGWQNKKPRVEKPYAEKKGGEGAGVRRGIIRFDPTDQRRSTRSQRVVGVGGNLDMAHSVPLSRVITSFQS